MRGVALFSSRPATDVAVAAAAAAAAAEVVGAKILSPMVGADAPHAAAIAAIGARALSNPYVTTSSPRGVAEVGEAAVVTGPSPVDIHHARSNHAATASSFVEALARVAGEPACYPHVRALLKSHPECVRVLQQLTMDLK